jgi:FlaA1/EpsC-like NDP-sugar epimerase
LTFTHSAALEALLGHGPVRADLDAIRQEFAGKSVLVTGAGGSIGSHLSSRLMSVGLVRLTCLDRNGLHLQRLHTQIAHPASATRQEFHVADILEEQNLQQIFADARPDFVFHVAAHKHVVPMESNVKAAVRNNVFGTLSVLRAAEVAGTQKLIFVSSDKAVHPVSIVGVTKRIGELMLGAWPSSGMCCISARFGNVIGSSGSVLPIWGEQLENGMPLTLTDPQATRFFLLPIDAVTLLLEASSLGNHGDIFVFEMEKPVRILDLAHAFLRLNLRSPHESVIQFTGLGKGEKLEERLFYVDEVVAQTKFEKIKRTSVTTQDWCQLLQHLQVLDTLLVSGSDDEVRSKLQAIEPEYTFMRNSGNSRREATM